MPRFRKNKLDKNAESKGTDAEKGMDFEVKEEEINKEECDPEEMHWKMCEDIYKFLRSWADVFVSLLCVSFLIVDFVLCYLLSAIYIKTFRKTTFWISVLIGMAWASALISLHRETPGLVAFILKSTGILSFFFCGTLSSLILSRTNIYGINFDDTFVKIANWLCIIWLISAFSAMVSLLILSNIYKQKKIELIDFLRFFSTYAVIFCGLLTAFPLVIITNGWNNFNFDKTFFKIVACTICIVMILAMQAFHIWVPKKEIFRFICGCINIVMCYFCMSYIIIILRENNLLSAIFDETPWKIVSVIYFTFIVGYASNFLALIELPGLLTFILKFSGALSFLVVSHLTFFILTNLHWYIGKSVDETPDFVKTLDFLSVIWFTSVVSTVAALVAFREKLELKTELFDFLNFIQTVAFTFCGLLILLTLIIIICGNTMFGINFDGTFFTIVGSICYMTSIAHISVVYKWVVQFRTEPE